MCLPCDQIVKPKIAIIGAGISGLTLANQLKNSAQVDVFEKARGVGGRMSTRYAEPFSFDHGNQHFTVRTKPFQSFLNPYLENGSVCEWSGKVITLEIGKKITKRLWFEPHFVASPNMNQLCKALSDGISIQTKTEIAPLTKKEADGWDLYSKEGIFSGTYNWVIVTAPPLQTIKLFGNLLPNETPLHDTKMNSCYSLMIGFKKPWENQWIAAKVWNNPIDWISINSTKPGRDKSVTSIVAHSTKDWADANIDADLEEVKKSLVLQFEKLTDISCDEADYISVHRWKYATVFETRNSGFYIDEKNQLAATGDWASASRIEEVWASATNLADHLKMIYN